MPTLNIPEDGYEGLHHIASLNEETFKAMMDGLVQMPATVYHIGRLVQCIADSTKLPKEVASSIGQAISGLAIMLSRGPLDVKDFVDEVLKSARSHADESDDEPAYSDREIATLGTHLGHLLGLENIVSSAVALDNLLEVERPLSEARVFADLRPIFAKKGETSISAFAVTTTLKVAWFDPTGGHETYFTLDEADVDSLLSALSEAKRQASALKDFVKASGVPCVELGERW
ncbi:hypothetical protein [Burkholderia cepacia]|uniref:hypothetical protein n=1 Tax=Burkholderia cepacia TaxID=292 RepID=UPI000755D13B|nr:hypothetical protein [Burkholderia cepacia]KVA52009.1 hypothetical protein WI47_14475 [Burkholderia cepacia]KVC29375.1 hypothetical protein WI70_03915 [Burkholderia cepacia]